MIFTNAKAYDCLAVMRSVHETGRLGYAIAKNMRKIQEEIKEYSSLRDNAVQKYSTFADGHMVIPKENIQKYLAEFSEFDNIESDVAIMTVDEETFCSGGLTNNEMFALDWMVDPE